MKLGDLSSVVQLGVGLHAGTAILQSVAEFMGTPLSRRIERLRLLAEIKAKRDPKYNGCFQEACDLLGDLEVKKVQFFNEYKEIVSLNAGIAIALAILLSILAFCAEWEPPLAIALAFIALSLLPAGGSLIFLQNRWTKNTKGLSQRVIQLEECLLGIKE